MSDAELEADAEVDPELEAEAERAEPEAEPEFDEMEPDDARPASLAARIVLWVVFAILYAYPLFEGVSNLVGLPALYAEHKLSLPGGTWALLILGVLVPVVLYVAAVLVGRRRELFPRALLLAVGLAASNALFLSVLQWASVV